MPRFFLDLMGSPPPKKGLHGKMPQFCSDYDLISKTNKKRSSVFHILISQCHFDGPSEAHELSAGPLEANGPHDGPPKIHGPRDHCPTQPPLVGPAGRQRVPAPRSVEIQI